MVAKDLQTLNVKFDKVMFNSLVLTWERNLISQAECADFNVCLLFYL